jgi:hypothetical protein
MNGCIERRDRCATAVCAVRHEACARVEALRFHRSGCAADCARCTRDCEGAEGALRCIEQCLRRRSACSAVYRHVCSLGEGPEYGLQYLDGGLPDAALDAPVDAPDAGAPSP